MKNLIKKGIFLQALFMLISGAFIHGDGFIVVPRDPRPLPHPRPHFRPFPLEVKYHNVDVKIEDMVATTSIDQAFFNPTRYRLEGYYLFPVPAKGVIKKFSMFINGKETEAELLDAGKARRIYEDIVRRMRDPALLEYSGRKVFKARIYPIEPFSEKRVRISYTEILNKDNSTTEYIYPLNTEKFSSKPLKNVRIITRISSSMDIRNIYCPTHKVDIVRKSNRRANVVYEEINVRPDTDFKLYFDSTSDEVGISLRSYKKRGEDGYFLLNMTPGFGKKTFIIPKDVCFVLDISGSMSGKKLEKAKGAIKFCITNLRRGDRFEVIKFSTEAEGLFNALKPVNGSTRERAIRFINDLRAIGGTNVEEALAGALKMKKDKSRPYIVVFITDGKPTIGETDENKIIRMIREQNVDGTRIFTFGIGSDLNTHLLDKITSLTKAYRSYISGEEDIEVKISAFFRKIESPVLTNLSMDFGPGIRVSKKYPHDLPDLFRGSSVSILGRYTGSGNTTIILKGEIAGRTKIFRYMCEFASDSDKDDFIPLLWASRRIGFLLDQIRLNGEEKEIVDEVIVLAKKYGIITPYTSYLIVEDEKKLVRRREIEKVQQVLAPSAADAEGFSRYGAEESASLKQKTGRRSVRASKEVQGLNMANNYAEIRQGKKRLNFMSGKGEKVVIGQQMKNIQGRTVYYNGNIWIDSDVHLKKYSSRKKIRFGGEEYFTLLKKAPSSAQFLALGKNIQFILKGTLYEIYEN
ncbi:MAG: VWA domain-containing protein [Candidatus Aminicenantes bacterium]|nr:VWA domain-containing protein [Candidatus Aminicenantes bacterium]